MVGFCKDGAEPSDSVTGADFPYFMNDYPYVCDLFVFLSLTFLILIFTVFM
jgi:hypothetical protein